MKVKINLIDSNFESQTVYTYERKTPRGTLLGFLGWLDKNAQGHTLKKSHGSSLAEDFPYAAMPNGDCYIIHID